MSDQEKMAAESQKRAAGRKSVELIEDGMVVGLGTGTTVRYMLEALGERVRAGLKITGIPTSSGTEAIARQNGIPLGDLNDYPSLDIAIDGADEIDPRLNLIKGLGRALVREKLVESCAQRLIIVGDEKKLVPVLGSIAPVPVAVVPFGWRRTQERLGALGCRPEPRLDDNGELVVSDDGLHIVDCYFGRIADPERLEERILLTTGVVSTGLFVGFPITAMVARADLSIEVIDRGR